MQPDAYRRPDPVGSHRQAFRQSNQGLRYVEIRNYLNFIRNWPDPKTFLITFTQDRGRHTSYDQIIEDQVDDIRENIAGRLVRWHDRRQFLWPSTIGFFEDADCNQPFRHIHSIWSFRQEVAEEAENLLLRTQRVQGWWGLRQSRGTADIRPLPTVDDVERTLMYSTKGWERTSPESITGGQPPRYFFRYPPFDPAKGVANPNLVIPASRQPIKDPLHAHM